MITILISVSGYMVVAVFYNSFLPLLTTTFKFSMVALISTIPPGMWYCLGFIFS